MRKHIFAIIATHFFRCLLKIGYVSNVDVKLNNVSAKAVFFILTEFVRLFITIMRREKLCMALSSAIRQRWAHFFAERMALTVKQSFYGICFDLIVAVPMPYLNEKRRGYNQSNILAEKIGEILKIPFYNDILYAKRKKSAQHKLTFENRFRNVENIYYTNKTLNGKTVLLVDDIKTSGATLSECAKQLYKAGADKVYCVTGLITEWERK